MLFDTVLAFDHVRHRILIIANARITGDEDLESLYQFACAKIEFVERELERALSKTAPPRGTPLEAASNVTRETFEEMVRDGQGVHRRRRHLPGRCCRSASRPRSAPTRSPSTARCGTSTRRRTCTSSAWATARSSARRRRCWCASKAAASRRIRLPARGRAARPKKRTCGSAEELKRNEKERAEHVMLVDLGRNDLGRVCEYGTVRVPTYMALERYSHVMHLVSIVEGTLADDHDRLDALVAVLPGRHRVGRAEGARDGDHRRARADAARRLRRARSAISTSPATSTSASPSAPI